MSEAVAVVAPCPLEWELKAVARVDKARAAKDNWPTRVRILASATADGVANPLKVVRIGGNGDSPADVVATDHETTTLWVWAEAIDEPWSSPRQRVDLAQRDKKS